MKTQTTTKKKPTKIDSTLVKFTCASRKDFAKVTVKLSDLSGIFVNGDTSSVSRFVLDLVCPRSREPVGVIFAVNRDNSTAATNGWPHRFELPQVGDPVEVGVVRAYALELQIIVTRSGSFNP